MSEDLRQVTGQVPFHSCAPAWARYPAAAAGCLLLLELRRVGAFAGNLMPQRGGQLLAVVGEELCIVLKPCWSRLQ